MGRVCRLPVSDLKIDHSYQRREVSEYNTLAIASEFSWSRCGTLIVMERRDHSYYIVDGQQRWLAIKRRQDIKDVPCLVFASDGPEHESKAFRGLNIRRKNVPALVKFNSAVVAGDSPEKEISEWLGTIGLHVGDGGGRQNCVSFPTVLINSWKTFGEACKQAIQVQLAVNGTVPLNAQCHKGITWLLHNGIQVGEYIDKLRQLGGRTAMERAIRSYEIETGKFAGERGCGIALLRLINFRRRGRKIKLPEAEA